MNRLESGEPREVIIFKIIQDGIYRHIKAATALSDYIHHDRYPAIDNYFDIMDRNEDSLEDAHNEALLCTNAHMKKVCRYLEEYFRFTLQILDDFSMCRLTNNELDMLTVNAWCALEQAEKYSRKCVKELGFRIEDEKLP